MATLDFLVRACLDPVQAALVLVIVLAYRGPHPIMVTGIAAAVVAEMIAAMMLAAVDYSWGLAPRLVAALVQAAILLWIVRIVRGAARGAVARSGVGRFSNGGTATFGSLGPASSSQRLAPWHMRGYVRRRIDKLRRKEMQP